MAANAELAPIRKRGWLRGFGNLLSNENGAWWRTRTWLVQCLIWLAVLNGLLGMLLWAVPDEQVEATSALTVFLIMSGIALPIGAVIAGQDAIIGEKQLGTAAWVLSKPVARPAFILAKLIAHALGFLVTGVAVQGLIAYGQVSLAAGQLQPVPGFIAALGLVFLNLLFYLTLALMLGTLFDERGAVIGISLALLLGYQLFLGIAPWLANVMPWGMVQTMGAEGLPMTAALATGQPVGSVMPIVATAAWCVIFTAVAIWRFGREEF